MRYEVRLKRIEYASGYMTVQADSPEEAERLALQTEDCEWDTVDCDKAEVVSIEEE